MTKEEITDMMRNGKQEKAFQMLYKDYPKIENLILQNGGSKQEALDIFQEALIVLYRKLCSEDFILTAAPTTYLYSVCRFMWYDEKRSRKSGSEWDLDLVEDQEQNEIEVLLKEEEKYQIAESALQTIGDKCLEILKMFYHQGKKMVEIAKVMHLKSDKIAKNQKYKCLERAKKKFVELKSEANH